MHKMAMDYIGRFQTFQPITVLEFGSRDVNGTPRALFPNAKWVGVDIKPGRRVDVVADATTYQHTELVDLAICAEVLEHCEAWRMMVINMSNNLKPGGRVIITTAGPTRIPHSAIDGHMLRPGDNEWYENIEAHDLHLTMHLAGFDNIEVDEYRDDVRATAIMGKL